MTMYGYIGIPLQKQKWFGFFCRDFLLRSLEKVNVTADEITEDGAKFTYESCTVVVAQDVEEERLEIKADYAAPRNDLKHLCQILQETADAITTAFSEVKITLVLQGKEWQGAAADVMTADRAGAERVKKWKGENFCYIDYFKELLPYCHQTSS